MTLAGPGYGWFISDLCSEGGLTLWFLWWQKSLDPGISQNLLVFSKSLFPKVFSQVQVAIKSPSIICSQKDEGLRILELHRKWTKHSYTLENIISSSALTLKLYWPKWTELLNLLIFRMKENKQRDRKIEELCAKFFILFCLGYMLTNTFVIKLLLGFYFAGMFIFMHHHFLLTYKLRYLARFGSLWSWRMRVLDLEIVKLRVFRRHRS